jgi:hypothetical protein
MYKYSQKTHILDRESDLFYLTILAVQCTTLFDIKPRVCGFIDDNGRQHVTRHIEPTTRSNHEIVQQAIVRHEYAVAGIDQSEAVPTNHPEPRRSKRDGKGQWHSKRLDEEQAEQFQKEEQRENRVEKMGGALHLPEIPRPVPICSALLGKYGSPLGISFVMIGMRA